MKYVQVTELLSQSCTGCVHFGFTGRLKTCVAEVKEKPGFVVCDRMIWIKDTKEARLAYITQRLTQEA